MKTTHFPSTQPTLVKRPSEARGKTELGWLHSYHSFSFGNYFDPDHMGYRSLRVINDDIVEPGEGFGEHPHRDAEIFTYVIKGELKHKDSMGNGSIIKAGDLQYMSAGRGVLHSEFNPSSDQQVHLLQIWLKPNISGGEPRYAEKTLGKDAKDNALTLLFSSKPRDGAIEIRADAEVYLGKLEAGKKLTHRPSSSYAQWLHLFAGDLKVLGESFEPGDSAAIENASELEIETRQGAQFLLFDLK